MSEPPPYRQPGHRRDDDETRAYPAGLGQGADSEPTRAYGQQPGPVRRYDDDTRPSPGGQGGPGYAEARRPAAPEQYRPPSPGELRRRALDPGALWSGGVVTAVVAALVALAGIIVIRGILKILILTSTEVGGTFGDANTAVVVIVAFVAALVATGILHALLLTTPQPVTFFGWIATLVTAIVALLPLTTNAPWDRKLATVVLDIVIGLVIGLLLAGAARRARRDPRSAPPAAGRR